MIENNIILEIEKLLHNKKIIYSKILSDSFNINCIKVVTEDNEKFIVKYYSKKKEGFNSIESEANNLLFFNNQNYSFFPKIISYEDKFLIMSFIDNNDNQPNKINNDLIDAITSIHSKKGSNYGFNFDTQIGGLRQINSYSKNWVEFYRDKRLRYIFDLINKINPMDKAINSKIDLLLKKIDI